MCHHRINYSPFLDMKTGLDNLNTAEIKTMLNLYISTSVEWEKALAICKAHKHELFIQQFNTKMVTFRGSMKI